MSVLDLDNDKEKDEDARYRRELIAGIKDAIRRGYNVSTIGSLLVHDPALGRKLLAHHRFKLATLRTAHANLKKLAKAPPRASLIQELLAQ
jgi:hypothetical protein